MSKKQHPAGFDATALIKQTRDRDRKVAAALGIGPEPEPETDTVDDTPAPEEPAPAPKDEGRRRKNREQDFESLFIRESNIIARSGKTVNICEAHHATITQILHVIGKNKISHSTYVHNVLAHHFATFKDEINDLHVKRNSITSNLIP